MLFFIVVGWILLSGVSAEASDIIVSKHVGEYVMITCSHSFADENVKYFCRDPCKEQEHVLIKSDQSVKSPSGRYRLEDTGKGVFMVTITDLQKSDTGTYYCGVERTLKDTFTTVILTVTDAPPPPTNRKNPPTATPAPAPERTSRCEEPSTSSSTSTISTSTPSSISPSINPSVGISSRTTEILVCAVVGVVSVTVFVMVALYSVLGSSIDPKTQNDLSTATFSLEEEERDGEAHSDIYSTVIYCTANITRLPASTNPEIFS